MALSPLATLLKVWTQKPPQSEKEIVEFIAREGLPLWGQIRGILNTLVTALNNGTLQIFGVLIRFGTGVPTAADPDGSVFVRTDPPTGTTWLYYRFGGAWVLFAGGGGGTVTSVTAGTGLTQAGTATDPIINLVSAGGTLTVTADNVEVAAALVAGAFLGASSVQSVSAGAGLVNSGTATAPIIDAVAEDPTLVMLPNSMKVGVISDVNVDETIVTEEGLAEPEDLVAQVVEMMESELALLRNIDENLAAHTNALPLGDDE